MMAPTVIQTEVMANDGTNEYKIRVVNAGMFVRVRTKKNPCISFIKLIKFVIQ